MAAAIRLITGLVLGWVTAQAIMTAGFALLRGMWPEYALAEPDKAFTLAMLFARLIVFTALISGAASVATLVSRDERAAWLVGGVVLLLSLPQHLYYVWADYPACYHFVYLFSILPIAVYSGKAARRLFPRLFIAEATAQP